MDNDTVLQNILGHIEKKDWGAAPVVCDGLESWPPIGSGMPPVVARVPAMKYGATCREAVEKYLSLVVYGLVGGDGMIYFITQKLKSSLSNARVQ